MKRTMMILFCVCLSIAAMAQANLRIGGIMNNDKTRKAAGVTDMVIKGNDLKGYDINYYHSMTLDLTKVSAQLVTQLETAAREDGKTAVDREVIEMGGRLYYAEYTLRKTSGGFNRYIFFKNPSLKGGKKVVTVIYIEGEATLAEIKKIFGPPQTPPRGRGK